MKVHVDVLVVGSGFGGSVAALRLTEKGYRVVVLEAGRRFAQTTLPKTRVGPGLPLGPALGLYGIQRIHLLGNVMILAGAGVGGGSLNYANTLYVPPKRSSTTRSGRDITDWRGGARSRTTTRPAMLGVALNPTMTPADVVRRRGPRRWGWGATFGSRRWVCSTATATDAPKPGGDRRPVLRRCGPAGTAAPSAASA